MMRSMAENDVSEELVELRSEVEHLRALVGPSEDDYRKLQLDLLGARDVAIAAEAEAGVQRGRNQLLETELARALGMTKGAFRKWVAAQGEDTVKTYPMPPGMRGGHRYRMGQVLDAFNASAQAKVDAMRRGR
jgi:hypothetical protein